MTELGPMPESWEAVRLKDISFGFISGGTPSTKNLTYWDGDIPWMTSAHINGRAVTQGVKYITEEGLKNSATNVVPKNNILIATRVGIGKVAVNLVDMTISQDLTGVVLDHKKADVNFVYWLLSTYTTKLKSLAQGSTIKGLLRKEIENLKLPLPPLPEQRCIAEILTTADTAIRKVDDAIAKTERLKRGLMQELLTKGIGHEEFKDSEVGRIPRGWEVVKLEDVLELCQYGLSVKMSDEGKYPIVRMDEIKNGNVVSVITKYVDLDGKTLRNFKLEKGDILFNRTNSYELVGRTGIFLNDGNYVFASYLIRLRPKHEIVDPLFLTFYLIFSNGRLRQLATRAVHQANINATNLKKFKVSFPEKIEEQRKIAEILSTIDKKLKFERKRKKKLERVKNGLMNSLISGKVRVKNCEVKND
jgi:type I restriction enzyme S subunit